MELQKAVWTLNQLPDFGIQKFKRLRETVRDLNQLFDPQFRIPSEWTADLSSKFQELSTSDKFEQEIDKCRKAGIRILSLLDPEYPKNLSAVYDPPLILYIKGNFIPEDEVAIAVVGSRHPTTYGIRIANRLARELAEKGVTVVSGFARGIDGQAHRGAISAKGRTIAVLGSGLDVIYPKEHELLFEEISEHGALISEFPLGTPPQAFNFPKRNRIISGLARGVLVVEASQKSGSLITARLAAEEGREVYSVPGPIDSIVSSGTNQLIQTGAKLVMQAENILEDLAPQIRASLDSLEVSSEKVTAESKISNVEDPLLKLLTNQPLSFDEIAVGVSQNPAQLRSRLTYLELEGIVKRVFGGRYVRS
ncbi:MAG: DNA protecting protein DprA [Omnitrophica bacterium RIFCSPHIGHO2_02_FULL_46_11]|nr:MAG: DNA protecting protein DprA [Omnitrophica bacterium RIFCSPHIGHO2_02_FULL_46_11]OGW87661.1 MAG: DNA protecting protein DprA [Omnitrophica bacterium RIFCSPLOWO2_01_FULL_45_10b]